jgi:dCMP deaminase
VTKQILLYVPVVHAGYEQLLDRHADADEVLLLGRSFAADYRALAKDIRALAPERVASYLRGHVRAVRVVETDDLPAAVTAETLVVPAEETVRSIVSAYGLAAGRQVIEDGTFLRWDRDWSRAGRPVDYTGQVSLDEASRRLMARATAEAARSSDWWRQVGALLARDGSVLAVAHNAHRPTEYTPYIDGDPRDNFSRGVEIELSTAIHAEARLVGWAARHGVALEGADLFVSTFPCPVCARLVAETGIRRCYFGGSYSVLDGEQVLKQAGVEVIWVENSAAPVPAGAPDPPRPRPAHARARD